MASILTWSDLWISMAYCFRRRFVGGISVAPVVDKVTRGDAGGT